MRQAALLPVLGLLATAAPATAETTVEVGDAFAGDVFNPAVLITDDGADVNTLTISYVRPRRGDLVVTVRDDSAPLRAGDGCASTPDGVRCDVEDIVFVRARLGGGNDRAVASSPARGSRSCGCVWLQGGEGNDKLTSHDGATLHGDDGDDRLVGRRNTARRAPGGLRERNSEEMSGGAGDDTLAGGLGPDVLAGGYAPFGQDAVAPGRDRLNGGPGNDSLDDGDDLGGEIGPDTIIGGTDDDTVHSYARRAVPVVIDLAERGGDGQEGEGDDLVNVEEIFGGRGDDRFAGDGDRNIFWGLGGNNRIRGRGGDDAIFVSDSGTRNSIRGDRGDDILTVEAFESGPVRCGPGEDQVIERRRGSGAPRQVDPEQDRGPWIAASCEQLGSDTTFAIDPVPDDAPAPRTLLFDRSAGRFAGAFELQLTAVAPPPFEEIAEASSTPRGFSVRLPGGVARRTRRSGASFRVEVWGGTNLRMLWRFRQRPAR